jgi:hypothetical protein
MKIVIPSVQVANVENGPIYAQQGVAPISMGYITFVYFNVGNARYSHAISTLVGNSIIKNLPV